MGKKGIDIWYHQGDIDFAKVKADGVDFAIIRDGWGTDHLDPKLVTYAKDALANGVEVPGVFHFIYGINTDEAIANADMAIKNVVEAGLPTTTCIWCDLESDTIANARDYRGVNLTNADIVAMTKAFCNRVMEKGYPTGIYTNQDYLFNIYGKDIANEYDIWLADLEGEAGAQCVYRQYDWYAHYNGISGNVDADEFYGQYTAGTSKPEAAKPITETTTETIEALGGQSMKPKASEYVKVALAVLDRPQGLNYKNWFPNNCGYCEQDKSLSGDCWNMNPKATVWSLYLNDPVSNNYTAGKYYYQNGINASNLPDCTGNTIMNNYCTETTFRAMIEAKKAPCMLLISGAHMGAYLGDFERDGKTYNVTEFSPNDYLESKMRSYVDEYGRRLNYKGGTVIGTWNRCGYLTAFLDYDEEIVEPTTPDTDVQEETTVDDISASALAMQIYAGKWGNGDERKNAITAKYGTDKYAEAQEIVNKIVSGMQWYKTEVNLAEEILAGKWGNGSDRQNNITLKYGANAYRIAQNFVNCVCNEDYTIDELKTAYKVAGEIICGVHGNGEARKQSIVSKYGETVRALAQQFVNEILK